jgi:hypothetical protein
MNREVLQDKAGDLPEAQRLQKKELLAIIHSLSRRKVQNKDMWVLLISQLIRIFNQGDVTLRELASLVYDLSIINLKSAKIYDIIVDYHLK